MSDLHDPVKSSGTQPDSRDQRNQTSLTNTGQLPALAKTVGPSSVGFNQPKSATSQAGSTMQFLDSHHSEQELIMKHEAAIKASQLRRASYNP